MVSPWHYRAGPISCVARWVSTGCRLVSAAIRMTLAIGVLGLAVVGAPWALVVFIGWPLPTQVPTWEELQRLWDIPASDEFILDVLAVAGWAVWLVLIRYVIQCARATVQGIDWSRVRPGALQALIGTTVGAVLGWLLTHRGTPAGFGPLAPVDVQSWAPPVAGVAVLADHYADPTASLAAPLGQPHAQAGLVEVVRGPEEGIYDSLWRIAERTLGDGTRWPEIYALNAGLPQPDGRTLDNPNLIHPGWHLLIPTPPTSPPAPTPQPAPATPAPSEPPTVDEVPDGQNGSAAGEKAARWAPIRLPVTADDRVPGFEVGPETFLGLGAAAVLSAALMRVRARRRRAYTPGSGDRADLHTPPVIRAVHAAHTHATRPPDGDLPIAPIRHVIGAGTTTPEGTRGAECAVEIGAGKGLAVAIDLARTHGLGLVGPGAVPAARAILLGLLAHPADPDDPPTEILIPTADAQVLMGHTADDGAVLGRIHLADSVDTLLDDLEIALLTRLREHTEPHADRGRSGRAPLTMLATPTPGCIVRLQAVLDNGAGLGISGVLLGQWRPGATLYVHPDGTAEANNPTLSDAMTGARLCTATEDHLTDLLRLLADAAHHNPNHRGPDPARSIAPTMASASRLRQADDDVEPATPDVTEASAPHEKSTMDVRSGPSAPSRIETEVDEGTNDVAKSLPAAPCTPEPDVETPTGRSAPGASSAPPAEPPAVGSPSGGRLLMRAVGPLQLHWQDGDGQPRPVTNLFGPRQLELILFLALHPDGVHSDLILDTLWGEYTGSAQPRSSLHATLSRLRASLAKTAGDAPKVVLQEDSRYRLNRDVVEVDLWGLLDTLGRARHPDPQVHDPARRQVAAAYTGRLADGLVTDWIDTPRETLHRDAVDAIAGLSHTQTDTDPAGALELAEAVRAHDPYNEPIYQHIMRLQGRLGRHDAVLGTLHLLSTRLAEIDAAPNPETVRLATDIAMGPTD